MRPLAARLDKDLAALVAATDPLERLDAARRLRERCEQTEAELVAAARADGISWRRIGAVYGTSKQGAQQRFKERPPSEPPPPTPEP